MPESPRHSLTIFLIKEGRKRENIIKFGAGYSYKFVELNQRRYHVYAKRLSLGTPEWWGFFEKKLPDSFVGETDSPGVVLILDVDDRLFALTFGSGRYALIPDCYEEQFGLRVVLNSVDKVRSMDKKTFDAIDGRTRTQASSDREVSEFEFDIERDLLRGVTGTPEKDTSLGVRLSGVDSLSAMVRVDLATLPSLLRKYRIQSNSKKYREKFEFVDHMTSVSSPALKDQLNAVLVDLLNERNEQLKKKTSSRTFAFELTFPEVIDFSKVTQFGYTFDPKQFPLRHDIGLSTYLPYKLRKAPLANIDQLKRAAIYGFNHDMHAASWSVYKCLAGELKHKGDHYILSDGSWYRIEKSYVKQLDKDIDHIPRYDGSLPDYAGGDEKTYNENSAKTLAGFYNFDRKLIHPISKQNIEFCDLYCESNGFRDIIHVKHGTSSAVLSHLFAQATTSAELCTDYDKCRRDANDMVMRTLGAIKCSDPLRPTESRTIFGIIRPRPGSLPFFSKVNLRRACRDLRRSKMKYALAEIPYDPAYLITKVASKKT